MATLGVVGFLYIFVASAALNYRVSVDAVVNQTGEIASDGSRIGDDPTTAWDSLVGAQTIQALLGVIAVVAFLMWFYRAYRNLNEKRFGIGWAVGAWFVPGLNLVRPKQIMNDIWRGTMHDSSSETEFRETNVASVVHWWWAILLISTFAGILSGIITPGPNDEGGSLDSLLSRTNVGASFAVVEAIAGIAATGLAIRIVWVVSQRQDATSR